MKGASVRNPYSRAMTEKEREVARGWGIARGRVNELQTYRVGCETCEISIEKGLPEKEWTPEAREIARTVDEQFGAAVAAFGCQHWATYWRHLWEAK